ncbi:uncharacterized protein LOC116196942 [Punica granatum]|uniref:Uncharacterized protein LOC116196942 n=1 Tax=Punica granatum TaxID=22663 RepID=A0A218XVQ5_PUNGR|nr:uncharacterized protein LOC116196942 [Punica granatum]OWM89034.1 hypothetical protein CDL15_Pgr023880 [Punica granatum]
MAATTSRRHSSGPMMRSLSPSGRFYSRASPSAASAAASGFASSSSSFAARPSAATSFLQRSASPTRVNMYGAPAPNPSVRFSLDRSTSPSRPISVKQRNRQAVRGSGGPKTPRRTCMCSPTTHPGSFRCSLHKNCPSSPAGGASYSPNRLNARRSAMTNSLVRIGGVEGDLVKRALAALIRPSSHQQRRRAAFQSRPSRLSVMSRAEDS